MDTRKSHHVVFAPEIVARAQRIADVFAAANERDTWKRKIAVTPATILRKAASDGLAALEAAIAAHAGEGEP